jgi:hypothetical protein
VVASVTLIKAVLDLKIVGFKFDNSERTLAFVLDKFTEAKLVVMSEEIFFEYLR